MKLRNGKDDARISKRKSLNLRDQFNSSFLHNNLWVFIVSPQKKLSMLRMLTKEVNGHDLILIRLYLHKRRCQFDK